MEPNYRMKQSTTNKSLYDYIPVVVVCLVFLIVGILFVQNEVFQDDWYIEASADGFFGNSNRSLFVVGPNYLITGLIWVLSLTGIRLFWLHILLVLFNFLSHLLISCVMVRRVGSRGATLSSVCIGLLFAPIVSFELQFTTTAAYVITSGCFALLDAVERDAHLKWKLLAIAWIVIGSSLRFDCLVYSVLLFGLLWLLNSIDVIRHCDVGDRIIFTLRRLAPFAATLFVCVCLELSHNALLNWQNPGFSSWNAVRASVDDYALPSYDEAAQEYEQIGLSKVDVNLLKSWNNIDENTFSEETYNKLKDIKLHWKGQGEGKDVSLLTVVSFSLFSSAKSFIGTTWFWEAALFLILIVFLSDRKAILSAGLVFLGSFALYAYLLAIGRLIWRTEWPIWIALISALLFVFSNNRVRSIRLLDSVSKTQRTLLVVALFCLAFFGRSYNADSALFTRYKDRINNPNTYGRYIISLVTGKTINYVTYSSSAAVDLSEDDNHFYFSLWSNDWLQQYPLYAVDTFRFFPIGSGKNWGTLGQYQIRLKPIRSNFSNWKIDNPFEALTNEKVRVAARPSEALARNDELLAYLNERYSATTTYSVDRMVANDTMITRYCDVKYIPEADNTDIAVSFTSMVSDELSDFLEIDARFPDSQSGLHYRQAFLVLTNESGVTKAFSCERSSIRTTIPKTQIGNGNYIASLVFETDEGNWLSSASAELRVSE